MTVDLRSIEYEFGFSRIPISQFDPVIGWVNTWATLYLNSKRLGVVALGFSVLEDGSLEHYGDEVFSDWDVRARNSIDDLCVELDCDESELVEELNKLVDRKLGRKLKELFLKEWKIHLQKLMARTRSSDEREELRFLLRKANNLI